MGAGRVRTRAAVSRPPSAAHATDLHLMPQNRIPCREAAFRQLGAGPALRADLRGVAGAAAAFVAGVAGADAGVAAGLALRADLAALGAGAAAGLARGWRGDGRGGSWGGAGDRDGGLAPRRLLPGPRLTRKDTFRRERGQGPAHISRGTRGWGSSTRAAAYRSSRRDGAGSRCRDRPHGQGRKPVRSKRPGRSELPGAAPSRRYCRVMPVPVCSIHTSTAEVVNLTRVGHR